MGISILIIPKEVKYIRTGWWKIAWGMRSFHSPAFIISRKWKV